MYEVQYLNEDLEWVEHSSHQDKDVARLVMKKQMRTSGDPWRVIKKDSKNEAIKARD